MVKALTTAILLTGICFTLNAQQVITFKADDNVTVTADHYVTSTQNPYIILLHQAGYSRGEYRETGPKFANLGFNCLAVDLRSGNEVNFIKNLTTVSAQELGFKTDFMSAMTDITAALQFVAKRSNKPVILVGSSYSASLAIIAATENFRIQAVIAFSPGEYFGESVCVKELTQSLYVPLLAMSTKLEYNEMAQMLNHISSKHLQLFKPSEGEGVHGSKALWDRNTTSDQYWMAITQFISQLKLN
ncbi:MAG: dienelactone hydrolase family protein [Bacteroidales bacterium]